MELKIKKNPSYDEYSSVAKAIKENNGYCCCKLAHIPDNLCICKEFAEQEEYGFCECGRYYKTPEFPIITLCGSTRFKDEFLKAQKELTLAGWIVLSVGLFGHAGDKEVWEEDTKEFLDNLHKSKIEMSDAIYVINKDGYIGESTRSEIEWARKLYKQIIYMEEPK